MSPPLAPIVSQIHLFPSVSRYVFQLILILSFHPRPGLGSGLFLSGFKTKLFQAFLFVPMYATKFGSPKLLKETECSLQHLQKSLDVTT